MPMICPLIYPLTSPLSRSSLSGDPSLTRDLAYLEVTSRVTESHSELSPHFDLAGHPCTTSHHPHLL
jgi:hypothetical protein